MDCSPCLALHADSFNRTFDTWWAIGPLPWQSEPCPRFLTRCFPFCSCAFLGNDHGEQRYIEYPVPVSPLTSFFPSKGIHFLDKYQVHLSQLTISSSHFFEDQYARLFIFPELKAVFCLQTRTFSWLKKLFFWFTFLKTVPTLCKSCILGSSHCTGVCWIWEWPGRNQPQIFQVSLPCPQCSFSEHRAKNLNRLIQSHLKNPWKKKGREAKTPYDISPTYHKDKLKVLRQRITDLHRKQ